LPDTQDSPISYPKLEIPGKGIYDIKFGLRAAYELEEKHGLGPTELGELLQTWAPKTNQETGEVTPGRVSQSLVFKILSCCLAGRLDIKPEQLADCFDWEDIPAIARTIAEAFAKMRRSTQSVLPGTAAETAEQKPT